MKRQKQLLKTVLTYCIALLGVACYAPAAVAADKLEKISYSVLPGNNIEVTMEFAGTAPEPASFTTDNPPRIVFDFPNTQLSLKQRSIAVGTGPVEGISAVEAGSRSRVVVNLVSAGKFAVNRTDKRLIIEVGESAQPSVAVNREPRGAMQPASLASAAPVSRSAIIGVDFRRSENGAAQIVAKLSDPSTPIDMKKSGKNVMVEFKDVILPERLNRRLDVTDFATPVTAVDTKPDGNSVKMEIFIASKDGEYEHMAYQTDDIYIIEIKQVVPKRDAEEIPLAERTYSGQQLSFDFQKIDVASALYLIADLKEKNLVFDTAKVKGDISLRLKNVPWDQALDIILDSRGLGLREIGNVWSVEPRQEIEDRRKRELEAQKEIKELEPLRTEFIPISYSKANEIKALIKSDSGGTTQGSYSFLSSRGSVSVDERTNTLLVQDTAEKIAEVRRVVAALDQPVRQVLIASRIVVASSDFGRDLGVKFGNSTNYRIGDNGWGMVTGGKRSGDTTFPTGVSFNEGGQENFILDLPANPASGLPAAFGLAIGRVGSYLLQLELSALESEGRGEIISSPRVITANQKPATIKQGVEVPVQGVAGVGAAAAPTFKSAVLSLEVTPQITPDDRVIMDLKVTKDDVQPSGNFGKREVQTQVLVDNGETVVLGGVYEQTAANTVERVPFFGDLPIVGALFRRTHAVDSKQELLIFVTPKILKEGSS